MARTMTAEIIRENKSGLSYVAKIPVAQRRMFRAHEVTHPEIVIPRSWTKLDGPPSDPASKPVLDADGKAEVDLRAATGKIPHSAVAGPRAVAIVEAANLAREHGAISLVAFDGREGAYRCAAEAANTEQGREYIGKVAALNPEKEYAVIESPKPIDWRNFREASGPKGRIVETDQITPDLLDLECAGWREENVYDVCPRPPEAAPKAEAAPTAEEEPVEVVNADDDAEDRAMAARLAAKGGAAGAAPTADNTHGM